MTLFKTDLFRSFAIGFLLGTAALMTSLGSEGRMTLLQHILP